MTSVAVSPKFQIVIPKLIREALKIQPGQRVNLRLGDKADTVILEPEVDILSLKGFLKPIPGVDLTDIPDEEEDECWPGGCDPMHNAEWLETNERYRKLREAERVRLGK